MKVFVYSHTHWDREWYLSQNQFQYRLIRTVDEILDVLDADNSFNVFVLDGQTCVIEDYLELRPEQEARLRALIAAGKLAIGPWFTMPDVFLPDGESLIRNLARGYEDCMAFGAAYPNVGYVPDSFGHIEQLPQLLRGVGIDNFAFSRGRPEALAPGAEHKREFTWEAPDGSRVIAWPLPQGYTAGQFLPNPSDADALVHRVRAAISAFAGSHVPEIVVIPHGIDHCWLQLDIPEILDALQRLVPDVTFHHGSLQDALDAWKTVRPSDQELEVYRGQLRGRLRVQELHGTLSSRIDNKLINDLAEVHIENVAEPLDAMAGWYGKHSSDVFMRKAWQLICQNHAHDSICGCSQDRVHEDVNRRFREAMELGIDIADSALDYLNSAARQAGEPTAIVYAGLQGGDRVVDVVIRQTEPPTGDECFEDGEGTLYPAQFGVANRMRVQHTNGSVNYVEWRGCVQVQGLQPGEVRRLRLRPNGNPALTAPVQVNGATLENGLLRVTVNGDGTLDLEDSRSGGKVTGTHWFVQEADLGGGYHFEPLPGAERRDTRGQPVEVKVVASGPVRARLEVSTELDVPAAYDRSAGTRSGRVVVPIRSVLTLEAGSRVVKVKTTIANGASNQRIRLVLPTGMATESVSADASFAVHANAPDVWPSEPRQNSHPMRSFVSIAESGTGLSFLGRGLHEYEIVPTDAGTHIEVTLLRSVDFVFLCGTWETPEAQLHRSLTYEYALAVHDGDWRAAGIPAQAQALRCEAIAEVHGDYGNPRDREPHATTGFYVQQDNGVEFPVDSNRSAWKRVNAARDGWRRVEPERFVKAAIPGRIVPFHVEGRSVVISAFKRAQDGSGSILRFWSYADAEQTVTIRGRDEATQIVPVNLLEQTIPDVPSGTGSLALGVRPFEVVTVRLA